MQPLAPKHLTKMHMNNALYPKHICIITHMCFTMCMHYSAYSLCLTFFRVISWLWSMVHYRKKWICVIIHMCFGYNAPQWMFQSLHHHLNPYNTNKQSLNINNAYALQCTCVMKCNCILTHIHFVHINKRIRNDCESYTYAPILL